MFTRREIYPRIQEKNKTMTHEQKRINAVERQAAVRLNVIYTEPIYRDITNEPVEVSFYANDVADYGMVIESDTNFCIFRVFVADKGKCRIFTPQPNVPTDMFNLAGALLQTTWWKPSKKEYRKVKGNKNEE